MCGECNWPAEKDDWINVNKQLPNVDYKKKRSAVRVQVKYKNGKKDKAYYSHILHEGTGWAGIFYKMDGSILEVTHWKRK